MVNTFTTSLPLPQVFINRLEQTEQNPRYHAEGNVLTHTLMVLENVLALDESWNLSEEERLILYWAAILHDIGKPEVTKWEAGRFHSHGHEEAGVPIARDILLKQQDITPFQRHQILDLVRWHSIPLQYGLRNRPLEAYKKIAVRLDIRLLGIFAFCDLTGRICQNQEQVKNLIMYFNHCLVPQVQNELGSYSQLKNIYQQASQLKKDRLWAAVAYHDSRLLKQVLLSQESSLGIASKSSAIIPIGVKGHAMEKYLERRFPDAMRIQIDLKSKAHLHNAIFDQLDVEGTILFEGDFTQVAHRHELLRILRENKVEVNYLFFEAEISELLRGIKDPAAYAEIMHVHNRLAQPHPWEAHKTEYLRLSKLI